jgi:hypothetical protein
VPGNNLPQLMPPSVCLWRTGKPSQGYVCVRPVSWRPGISEEYPVSLLYVILHATRRLISVARESVVNESLPTIEI